MERPFPYHIHPEFNDVFRCRNRPLRDVSTAIHDDDEMFSYIKEYGENDQQTALWEYFTGGLHMLNLVRDLAGKKCSSLINIRSFLDFASGYGRLTRFLVKELSRERIWVCDIYANAVEFQEQQFGVHGVESVPDPEDFPCDERFDFVFVASLFSHLPEGMFTKWLGKLYSLLAPKGILVFSVHDEALLPSNVAMPATGFLFQPHSESRSLDKNQYGSTWVNEEFMRKAIREATGREVYARNRRGLWKLQDVYVVADDEYLSSSYNHIAWGPEGRIEQCKILSSSELLLSGWAADLSRGGFVAEVQVWINLKILARTVPDIARPDVALAFNNKTLGTSGWQFVAPVTAKEQRIVVNVVNNLGTETFLQPGMALTSLCPTQVKWC